MLAVGDLAALPGRATFRLSGRPALGTIRAGASGRRGTVGAGIEARRRDRSRPGAGGEEACPRGRRGGRPGAPRARRPRPDPSIPRTPEIQGALSGVSAAAGFWTALALGWIWRFLEIPPLRGRMERMARVCAVGIAGAAVVLGLWAAAAWQEDLRRHLGLAPLDRFYVPTVIGVALPLALALREAGRALRWLVLSAARPLDRALPRRVSIAGGLVLSATLLWTVASGALGRAVLDAVDASFLALDQLIDPDLPAPDDPNVSGGPRSLIAWQDLGRQGRRFVSTGPDAAEIGGFLAGFQERDKKERHKRWLDEIANGSFGFPPVKLTYRAKGKGSWKYEALDTRRIYDELRLDVRRTREVDRNREGAAGSCVRALDDSPPRCAPAPLSPRPEPWIARLGAVGEPVPTRTAPSGVLGSATEPMSASRTRRTSSIGRERTGAPSGSSTFSTPAIRSRSSRPISFCSSPRGCRGPGGPTCRPASHGARS